MTRSLRDAREMEESISGSLGAGGSGAPGPSGGDRFSAAALIEAAAADMGLRAGRPFYILSGEPPPPGDLRAGAIAPSATRGVTSSSRSGAGRSPSGHPSSRTR